MAKGDSRQRLDQRSAAQRRYVSKRGKTPEAHKEYQRNYWRLKSGADITSTTRPKPTHCEICGDLPGKKGIQWDHNHSTGKFRGWLCGLCNTAIGFAKDDPLRLEAMAPYLRNT